MEFDRSKYSTKPFQQIVEKPWGREMIYTPPEAPAVGKYFYVDKGKRLSLQYHDEKIETLCLIEGEAKVTIMDKLGKTSEIVMERGKGYFVRPGQVHRITAVSDIFFIESSTPETGNTYRLEDDNHRKTETEDARKKERGWTK